MSLIRLNVFRGAFDKVPHAQADLTWPELCDELEALTAIEAADKRELPAFTLGTLSEPRNVNANYLDHTALAIDVDNCPPVVLEQLEALNVAAFVYASPSDPNPDQSRRVRIVVPLSDPLPVEHVKHVRRAFAEMIGVGPGQGVETADAVSQLMFVGRIAGTPQRECWCLDGAALGTAATIVRPLALVWKKETKRAAKPNASRAGIVDPDERTIALLDVLLVYWEAPGEAAPARREVLRALGSYLAKRGWPDEQIAALVRGLPTSRPEALRMSEAMQGAADARANPSGTIGWTRLLEWDPEAAEMIESVAKDPREPDGFVGVWSERWAKIEERAQRKAAPSEDDAEPFAPAADNAPSVPLFLCSRKSSLTLIWEGDDRGHRPIAEKRIRLRVRELGYDNGLVQLYAKGGKPLSADAILEGAAESYSHTTYAFANRITRYDATGEGRVTIGYPGCAMPGVFDADADDWLRALGGKHYDRLAVWIASCAQGSIDRLAACLVLMGRADTGKSMFAHAVARMWGEAPPALSLLNVTFNGDLLRCPILADEEAQLLGSKALNSNKFRDMIQGASRSVELKGQERCELYGALRACVSCNGLSDLRFTNLGGPAVIEALRDRLLVIDATERADLCKAPLARLRVSGGWLVDLERIAAHMAWLCETVELPAERFLGAGGDAGDAAILAGHTDEHVDLWETFREWLEADGVGGSWVAHVEHGLCVDTSELAKSIERTGDGWSLRKVRAALAPFHVGDCRTGGDGVRRRVWILDAARIVEALALGLEEIEALERRLAGDPAEGVASRFGRAKFR